MGKRKTNKTQGVDPAYFDKQREAMLCRRFKVSSRSALIRQAVMERVLRGLEENHPTLF